MRKLGMVSFMVVFIVTNVLVNAFVAISPAKAATADDLKLSLAYDKQGIAGKSKTVTVSLENNSSMDWIYNINLEVELGDGLNIAATDYSRFSEVEKDDQLKQIVGWDDIKDLAPNESFSFSFDVELREDYRGKPDEMIDFGEMVKGIVTVSGSNDPQTFDTGGLTKTEPIDIEIVPFEVYLEGGGQLLKGAGTTTARGDDKFGHEMTVTIVNNNRFPLTIDLMNEVANGVQVNSVSDSFKNEQLYRASDGKSSWEWSHSLVLGETKTIKYHTAIFDKLTEDGTVNSGAIIPDGQKLPITLEYSGIVNNEGAPYTGDITDELIAKDIIIDKNVQHGTPFEYVQGLTYTLDIRVNEYHDMHDVSISDILQDGMTFLPTGMNGRSYEISVPYDENLITFSATPDAGKQLDNTAKTTLQWDVDDPTLFTKLSTTTITYKAETRDVWSNGQPIVAGDSLHNTVHLQATNATSDLPASSGSNAAIPIGQPQIEKSVLTVNEAAPQIENGLVKVGVGDRVKFQVTYDPTSLKVKQRDVQIVDIFPQGTKVDDSTIQYNPAWTQVRDAAGEYVVSDDLISDPNVLRWYFSEVPVDSGKLVVEYEAIVDNVPAVTNAKQAYNLAKAALQNSNGHVLSMRDQVGLQYAEPIVKINKTAISAVNDLLGTAEVAFQIELENIGLGDAYHVIVHDHLPAELALPNLGNVTGPGTAEHDDGHSIKFTIPEIAVDETVTLTYTSTIVTPIGSGLQFENEAIITSYQNRKTDPDRIYDKDYNDTPGFTLEKSKVDLSMAKATLQKSVHTPGDIDTVRVGDTVIYEIIVSVPTGTTAYNGYIKETIPDNQTIQAVYTDPTDAASKSETAIPFDPLAGSQEVTFETPQVMAAGDHVFYVETVVNAIAGDDRDEGKKVEEEQTNIAQFFWEDRSADGDNHFTSPDSTSVTVKRPQLTTELRTVPTGKNTVVQHEVVDFELIITNIGDNIAYGFVPTVTLPDEFSSSHAGFDDHTQIITFDEVASLDFVSPHNSVSLPFTVTLDVLPGAGESFNFIGKSGKYYPHEVKDEAAAYAESTAQRSISAPRLTISQQFEKHSNTGETFIRQGDEVEIIIEVVAKKGTIAYDAVITDEFSDDYIVLNVDDLDDSGAAITNDANNSTITIGTIDAELNEQTRRYKVTAQVDPNKNYATLNDKTTSNDVQLKWDNGQVAGLTESAATWTYDLKHPELTLSALTPTASTFKDGVGTITISIPVNNTRERMAHDSEITFVIPSELAFDAVSDSGTISGNTVTWSGIDIAGDTTKTLTATLKLNANGLTGAGLTGLVNTAEINKYFSRAADEGDRKQYGSNQSKDVTLNVADVSVVKTVEQTSSIVWDDGLGYVRPGDTMTYKIVVTVPQQTSAYNVQLHDELGVEQQLTDIKFKVGATFESRKDEFEQEGYLSLGTLSGGTYEVLVDAVVSTEGYNDTEYLFENTAEVKWASINGGPLLGTHTDKVIGDVKQPQLTLEARAVRPTWTTGSHDSVIEIDVDNTGETKAYNLELSLDVPVELTVSGISHGGHVTTDAITGAHTVTWSLEELDGAANTQLTVTVAQNEHSEANESVTLTAKLESYTNTESPDEYKIYTPQTKDVTLQLVGSHTLSADADPDISTYAGESHTFIHMLTNTGAGQDTYEVTTTAGYPAILMDSDDNVLAVDADGDGNWDGGPVYIQLAREDSKLLQLHMTVPVQAAKGTHSDRQLITTSISDLAPTPTQTDDVMDTVRVIGYDYNGFTFDGIALPIDEHDWQAGWSQSTVGAGSELLLTALTSRDITSVTAKIKGAGAGGGYIDHTNTDPITLHEVDIGKWAATYTLPAGIANGLYYVEFESVNAHATPPLQDIETEVAPKMANNMFRVEDPELDITLTPSKTTIVANDDVLMTMIIFNGGEGYAHRFKPAVELPQGVQFIDGSVLLGGKAHEHYVYDAASHTVSFTVYADQLVTMEPQEQLIYDFSVRTNDDISADEQLNFVATTGPYYTAEEETGVEQAARTDAAMIQSDTVILVKSVKSTTNGHLHEVRPGDEVVYELLIDIPEGVVVKNVVLENVLPPGSRVTAYEIYGEKMPRDTDRFVIEFPKVPQDRVILIYTTVTADHGPVITSDAQLTWEAQYRLDGGVPYQGFDDAQITIDVKKPTLQLISFTGDGVQFTTADDVITYTGVVRNSGDSTAYDAELVITLPLGLVPVEGSYGTGQYDPVAGTITWSVDEIAPNDEIEVEVKLGIRVDVPIATTGTVQFAIDAYYSTPLVDHRLKYTGASSDAPYSLSGSHQILLSGDETVKAGETAVFHHIVQNTGAGSNDYRLDVHSPYAVIVKTKDALDNDIVIGEKDADGNWVTGPELISLHAGGNQPLTIEVIVPIEAAKTTVPHLITVSVTDDHHLKTEHAQNKLNITGETLDGWVGNELWSQWDRATYRSQWVEPTYIPGSAIKIAAITSADAHTVTAAIHELNSDGTLVHIVETRALELINPLTFITDGLKKWHDVSYTLPLDMDEGSYFISYEATLHHGTEFDDTVTINTSEPGYNNTFTVQTQMDLVGTVTEQKFPAKAVPEATVNLKLQDGTIVATTETDEHGHYRFDAVDMKTYVLEVIPEQPYLNERSKVISVMPEHPAQTEVRVDVALLDFIITIKANPSTIVGDGIDETILTVTVLSVDGTPATGAHVELTAPHGVGIFMGVPGQEVVGQRTAVIGADGSAQIVYRSTKIDGLVSQHIPVTIDVADPIRDLYAEDTIHIIFAPGAIKGTVIDNETGLPVDQAVIVVYSDYDGDGEIDFYATQTTGPSGQYKIAIPRGEVLYTVEITKPVTIDGVTEHVTFTQISKPDIVDHTQVVEYPAINTVTGIILKKESDETTQRFSAAAYGELELAELFINADGHWEERPAGMQGTVDPATGIYSIELPDKDAAADNAYTFGIVRVIPAGPDNPVERRLIIGKMNVTLNEDGDVIISNELIDPYGIITDAVTGDIIVDAEVKLYFADTERNRKKGNTPHTLVPLPLLDDFPPADNANPHRSDEYGHYAWMVFSESDYYIVAEKPGYQQYKSEIIPVEFEIVEHNFEMNPIIYFPVFPVEGEEEIIVNEDIDLAIEISVNQRSYTERSQLRLQVDYINRSAKQANGVVIALTLPEGVTPVSLVNGSWSESGEQVIWELGTLTGGQLQELAMILNVEAIDQAERELLFIAEITSNDELINLRDDRSELRVMVFSNDYDTFRHTRYIQGYPDGEFKPNRNITRAEIATIFARILNLRSLVDNNVMYSDVPLDQWYADAVEAATKRGLFTGYEDGTFRPDQPITRAELTSVIFRFMALPERPPVRTHFVDLVGHWGADIIEDIRRNNIARGYGDATFKPDQYIIRSEAVTMINRLLYRGPLNGAEQSYPDVPVGHWAFGDVEESTRSHEASRNRDSSEQLLQDIEATLDF